MKVLSLLQPWATLVVIGAKRIETRSWKTKYRGEILIHASKRWDCKLNNATFDMGAADILSKAGYAIETKIKNGKVYTDLPLGAIIGSVNIRHIVKSEYCFEGNKFEWTDYKSIGQTNHVFELTPQELKFGDYSPNRYGWLLSDACRFQTPIPAKGSLSIWDWELPE